MSSLLQAVYDAKKSAEPNISGLMVMAVVIHPFGLANNRPLVNTGSLDLLQDEYTKEITIAQVVRNFFMLRSYQK